MRTFVVRAVEAFYHAMDMVTLADLTKGNCGLERFLALPGSLRAACAGEAALG